MKCALHIHQKILWACEKGVTFEVKRLIAEGAPVDWQDPVFGWAPLHTASNDGNADIVMLLLENKCNLNVTTKMGDTPLILAAKCDKMLTVCALVEAGCDITIRDNKNKTAAEWAKMLGYHALAEYLTNEAPRVQVHFTHRTRSIKTLTQGLLPFPFARRSHAQCWTWALPCRTHDLLASSKTTALPNASTPITDRASSPGVQTSRQGAMEALSADAHW